MLQILNAGFSKHPLSLVLHTCLLMDIGATWLLFNVEISRDRQKFRQFKLLRND